ncbi:MAG TPA: hypothetical protein PL066_02225 [bacterium]|nr:hypothetical protein [bacterium]
MVLIPGQVQFSAEALAEAQSILDKDQAQKKIPDSQATTTAQSGQEASKTGTENRDFKPHIDKNPEIIIPPTDHNAIYRQPKKEPLPGHKAPVMINIPKDNAAFPTDTPHQ